MKGTKGIPTQQLMKGSKDISRNKISRHHKDLKNIKNSVEKNKDFLVIWTNYNQLNLKSTLLSTRMKNQTISL
jgi:hypothetical protein